MQCNRLLKRAALAALLAVLGVLSWMGGTPSTQALDEHDKKGHPPSHVPQGLVYPRGEQINQVYRKPDQAELTGDEGVGIASERVMAFAAEQPAIKRHELELRTRFVTRISAEEEPEADAGVGAGAAQLPEALEAAGKERLSHHEYDVLYKGIYITKASYSVVVANRKAILVRHRNTPNEVAQFEPIESSVKFETASELAQRDAKDLFTKLYPGLDPILAVNTHPQDAPRLEMFLDEARKKGTLSWRLSIMSTDPGHPLQRRYWVAARDEAKILSKEDRIFYELNHRARVGSRISGKKPSSDLHPLLATASKPTTNLWALGDDQPAPSAALVGTHGKVTGTVWKSSPFSALRTVPLAGVDVTVIKQGIPHLTRTDRFGRYHLPGIAGPVTVQATLAGSFCSVINDGGGPVMTISQQGNGAINLAFTANAQEEFKISQITAFYSVNKVHDYAKAYLPQTPLKLARTPTHVNINQTCNAFWSPGANSLNFFRSSPNSCPNTAYLDVAFHEYGHGIDDELGGILDGGYSEGFGDSMAVLITRQPVIGFDFFGPPTGMMHHNLRDASEVHKWPDVKGSFDPHEVGEAYNGFTWELTRQLITKYHNEARAFAVAKKLILGAAAHNPSDIPDAVRWSFFVDAHVYPGNTGQPSQHYAALLAAAQSRELPVPGNPIDIFAE